MGSVLDTLRHHYADFSGRARRREYWLFQLALLGGLFVIGLMTELWGIDSETADGLLGLAFFAMVVPVLAVAVRRLHDTGRSGWHYFVTLIPIVGGFVFLYYMIQEGDAGPNEYGPDPKNPHLGDEATLDDLADVLGD